LVRPLRIRRRYLPELSGLRFLTPSHLTDIVFVRNAEIASFLLVKISSTPRLGQTCVAEPRLRVQIVGVEVTQN
jgi:hypothetical protein